ncbi:GNAT family N-acetyltransferase [Nonomuraea sp. NPDC050022]|uniref:GNAT family N-acetyltransferase n=1 Tax=Nonomuraea sp. NPDC050022 TaxID=3364358 RepID=UPI00378DA423
MRDGQWMIQPIDFDQPGDLVTGLYDAFVAGNGDDHGPVPSLPWFSYVVTTGGAGGRSEAWVAAEGGKVVGGYALALPEDDNTHVGRLFTLVVRPERRGRGLGSALFEHALERLRAHGRTLVLTATPDTGSGARFAAARGMTLSLTEARRTLDLRTADWAALERMRPEVDGYRLERWVGPAGPELLQDLATLMDGMNDAPRDADIEAANFSVDRVRSREQALPVIGRTPYTMIARRTSDGAPAGYTRILVDEDRSDSWGYQGDTTVLREHRGHRLGLLLKIGNLLWLHEREPHIERVITWNAVSNAHMLDINEAMGFEFFDEQREWRLEI